MPVVSTHRRAFVESLEDRRLMAADVIGTSIATYVRDGASYAATNFGGSAQLQVKQGAAGWNREGYVRFSLASVDSVASATLRLYGRLDNTAAAGAGFTVLNSGNTSWSESGTTWNSRLTAGTTVRGSGTVTGTAARWYDVDVSGFLRAEKQAGRNLVTFVIRAAAQSPSTIVFASDEATPNGPRLEVTQDASTPPPPATSTVAIPTATYVRDGSTYAGTNFGGAAQLQVKKGEVGWNREAYLRFDLSSAGTIGSAKLRLFGRLDNTSAAGAGFRVFNSSDTSWAETGVTWNSKPSAGTTVRGSGAVAGTAAKWYEVDLTSFLAAERQAGRNVVTLVIRAAAQSPSTIVFDSDDAANRPHVAVSAEAGGADLAALQRAYVAQRYGMMIHFGADTYTDGNEYATPDADRFDPDGLDTDQWAAVAKASGMRYGVLTAKHHSGFALWDSARTDYDVAAGQWYRNERAAGREGDVVRRYVDSFRGQGLGVGLYYSMWDIYAGIDSSSSPRAATDRAKAEITQLLTNYGQIQVLWTDGWEWKVGYDTVYWQEVYDHIKQISPATLLLENNDERTLEHSDIVGYELPAGRPMVPSGNTAPAEVQDTISDGPYWFYRSFNPPLQTAQELADKRRTANSRNANYLLNVGPDLQGRITDREVARLREVQQAWLAAQ